MLKKADPRLLVPICVVIILVGIFFAYRSSGLGPEEPAPAIDTGKPL